MANRKTIMAFLKIGFGIENPTEQQIEMFDDIKNSHIARPLVERYIAKGHSSAEIATRIGVTIDTVKWVRKCLEDRNKEQEKKEIINKSSPI